MIWGIIGIPFSLSILAMWYCETYTDSQFGQNARFISSATRMNDKSQSIGTLATGSTFLVGSIMMLDDKGRFPQFIPTDTSCNNLGNYHYWSRLVLFPDTSSSPARRSVPVHEAPRNAGRERRSPPAVRAFGGRRFMSTGLNGEVAAGINSGGSQS